MILACILLLASLALTLYWVIKHRGGFAWRDDPIKQFNFHPVLMVAGFITFSGFCEYTLHNAISTRCPIAFHDDSEEITARWSASEEVDQS